MRHEFEITYSHIINMTHTYKGIHYEKLKHKLVTNKDKDGFQVINDCEYEEIIDEITFELTKYGFLDWRHGYIFGTNKIPVGEAIPPYVKHEEMLYEKVWGI